jgi:hypothetical protein
VSMQMKFKEMAMNRARTIEEELMNAEEGIL